MFPEFKEYGLEQELSEKIAQRVVYHRNRFAKILYSRYLEILPSTIVYKNGNVTSVDWLKVEVALRSGYNAVIGETRSGAIRFLGFVTNPLSVTDPANFLISQPLTDSDIQFCIRESDRCDSYKEISDIDNCQTGNMVVLRNKSINYTNDYEIVQHYVSELAEIVCSRFSLKMQAKITTFFIGESGDETVNQIVNALYNGSPAVKVDGFFDPDEHIQQFDSSSVPQLMTELKREYQNTLNELNAMLGFSVLGVDKESGVNGAEASSGKAYTTANGNIYLKSRLNGIKRLNKRYNINIIPMFDDNAISTLSLMEEKEGKDNESISNTP